MEAAAYKTSIAEAEAAEELAIAAGGTDADPAVEAHLEEEEAENAGAILALILGCFMLVALIAVLTVGRRYAKLASE